jgi:hypothetical protein
MGTARMHRVQLKGPYNRSLNYQINGKPLPVSCIQSRPDASRNIQFGKNISDPKISLLPTVTFDNQEIFQRVLVCLAMPYFTEISPKLFLVSSRVETNPKYLKLSFHVPKDWTRLHLTTEPNLNLFATPATMITI